MCLDKFNLKYDSNQDKEEADYSVCFGRLLLLALEQLEDPALQQQRKQRLASFLASLVHRTPPQ